MSVPALLLAVAALAEGPALPERLGDFVRSEIEILTAAPGDRELYEEYKWKAAHRADYSDPTGRRMTVEDIPLSRC